MSEKEIVHNTYNIIKFPTLDESKRTIIFNFATYHIPEDKGSLLQTFYNQLCAEIEKEEKDFGAFVNVLASMAPYQVQFKVNPDRRQSAIYDPIEGRVIN